jgi:hypothetical protein
MFRRVHSNDPLLAIEVLGSLSVEGGARTVLAEEQDSQACYSLRAVSAIKKFLSRCVPFVVMEACALLHYTGCFATALPYFGYSMDLHGLGLVLPVPCTIQLHRVFQNELYNGIPNDTVWRVLRKRLHLKVYKLFILLNFPKIHFTIFHQ